MASKRSLVVLLALKCCRVSYVIPQIAAVANGRRQATSINIVSLEAGNSGGSPKAKITNKWWLSCAELFTGAMGWACAGGEHGAGCRSLMYIYIYVTSYI